MQATDAEAGPDAQGRRESFDSVAALLLRQTGWSLERPVGKHHETPRPARRRREAHHEGVKREHS